MLRLTRYWVSPVLALVYRVQGEEGEASSVRQVREVVVGFSAQRVRVRARAAEVCLARRRVHWAREEVGSLVPRHQQRVRVRVREGSLGQIAQEAEGVGVRRFRFQLSLRIRILYGSE